MRIFSKLWIVLLAVSLLASSLLAACSSNKETPTPAASPTPTADTTPIPVAPLWTGDSIVHTQSGAVKGFEDESDTWVWKAMPFAKPPVGELRWKAPRDPEPWEGVRENEDFCDMCIQYNPLAGEDIWGSEDCLYLNVWRPQSEETDLSVYVWIHGGGNTIGSANQTPTYMGANLASKSNMVFVSMNYRLGPFGWFTHPSLRTGDALDDSGNYGTLDIIKALEWIQENIESFGGNPDKVIVTGESAGAMNVFSLLASPVAENLFSTALIQSGMTSSLSMEYGEESAQNTITTMLVNDGTSSDSTKAETDLNGMSDTEIQAYLKSKSPDEIMACYKKTGFGMIDSPFIFEDGVVVVDNGMDSFDDGSYPNKVPIMIGSNKEELKMFLFMNEELVENTDLYQIVTSYGSDLWKVNGVDDVTRKLSSHPDQPDVFAYQFNWGAYQEDGSSPIPAPYDLTVGTAHSLDVPFFLGNPTFNVFMTDWVFTEENRPGREALTEAMMSYTSQFARTGNPNGSGLTEWKPWQNGTDQPKCLLFDADLNNAIIGMSTEELTIESVIDSMKSEVEEPLFSQAVEFINGEWTVSHLLEDVDVEYTPQSTIESTPVPTDLPESSPTPEPGEPVESAFINTYNVRYENEGATEDTVWTISRSGEETIDGVDCYIAEIEFDSNPERFRYVEMLSADVPLTVTGMTTWVDKATSQPVKADSDSTAMGFATTATTAFTYDGDYGAPFSEGKTWSYEMVSTPSMGPEMTSSWTAEVVGMENITVPAGTFDCYKLVHSSDSGDTNVEWWATIDGTDVAVKMIDEANWTGTETRELVSYIGGGE